MEQDYYNVGNIYGICTNYDEWDSRDHWDMCLEDLNNIGAAMISNERYGGAVGADDVLKDWEHCADSIDETERLIEECKSNLTDTTNDPEDVIILADELVELVETHKDQRADFKRFKRIGGYHYDLLVDLERYQKYTGTIPTDEHLKELLEEYSASGQGELETIRVVEIDQCPDWLEKIADLDSVECDDLGGFKMTAQDSNTWGHNLVSFLMDQGMQVSKRHKLTKVDQ